MAHAEALEPFAVRSYRYLRWSIVVVVLSLFAAVLVEWIRMGCFEGSISAYYYTPVQAVFVGGLVAIGVSLIAIKGSTDREDVLLNLAGVLAPIVAFVPTSPPSGCSKDYVIVSSSEHISNNVLAFAIGGAVALLLTFGIGQLEGKRTVRVVDPESRIVLWTGLAMLAAGLAWYHFFHENFVDYAHGGAAVTMFFIVGVVMVLNGLHRRNKGKSWLPYIGIATAMLLSALVFGAIKAIFEEWDHFILWLELAELLAFATYWVLQTFEHWDGGVPTGAEREPVPLIS